MKTSHSRFRIISRLLGTLLVAAFLSAASCGAPTLYEKEKALERTPCEIDCQKGTRPEDKAGFRICVRACEAKKDLDSQKNSK